MLGGLRTGLGPWGTRVSCARVGGWCGMVLEPRSVEVAASVSTFVFVPILVSRVCRCHVHTGPSYSCTHVHPAKWCKPVLYYPASVPFLSRELLDWPLACGAVGDHTGTCQL